MSAKSWVEGVEGGVVMVIRRGYGRKEGRKEGRVGKER